MLPVLYVTVDGVLDHIGFSQVLRVIEGVAQEGVPYVLVSMERPRDLVDTARIASVRARLAARGIEWHYGVYREGGARQVVNNLANAGRLAARVARRHRVGLVHARGYHGGAVARGVRALLGVPYLFDARGFWIDERIDEGRWFTTPGRVRAARVVERRLYRDAAGIVTLTDLQAGDLVRDQLGEGTRRPCVIPTCADYAEFRITPAPAVDVVPLEVRKQLTGRRVLAIVGSLNRAYVGPETAQLTRAVLDRDPSTRLLVLSGQPDAWRRCLTEAGVPLTSVVMTRADHEDMPAWLSLVDFGLLLLTPDILAKRASMPTKLAEFFAAGVRPVIHGCNPEVREWVRHAGSGLVLEGLDASAIAAAADLVCAPPTPGSRERAREITAPHFSLVSGVTRYASLLRELMSDA